MTPQDIQDILIGEAAHECLLEADLLHDFEDSVTVSIPRHLWQNWMNRQESA